MPRKPKENDQNAIELENAKTELAKSEAELNVAVEESPEIQRLIEKKAAEQAAKILEAQRQDVKDVRVEAILRDSKKKITDGEFVKKLLDMQFAVADILKLSDADKKFSNKELWAKVRRLNSFKKVDHAG